MFSGSSSFSFSLSLLLIHSRPLFFSHSFSLRPSLSLSLSIYLSIPPPLSLPLSLSLSLSLLLSLSLSLSLLQCSLEQECNQFKLTNILQKTQLKLVCSSVHCLAALLKIRAAPANCSVSATTDTTEAPKFQVDVRIKRLLFKRGPCSWMTAPETRPLRLPLIDGCPCPYPVAGESYLVTGTCLNDEALTIGVENLFQAHNAPLEVKLLARCHFPTQ